MLILALLLFVLGIIPFMIATAARLNRVAHAANLLTAIILFLGAFHIAIITSYQWLYVDPIVKTQRLRDLSSFGVSILAFILFKPAGRVLLKRPSDRKGR
jgi:hypothetical protein